MFYLLCHCSSWGFGESAYVWRFYWKKNWVLVVNWYWQPFSLCALNWKKFNSGKVSKRNYCILKSYIVGDRRFHKNQESHFPEQLTVGTISVSWKSCAQQLEEAKERKDIFFFHWWTWRVRVSKGKRYHYYEIACF